MSVCRGDHTRLSMESVANNQASSTQAPYMIISPPLPSLYRPNTVKILHGGNSWENTYDHIILWRSRTVSPNYCTHQINSQWMTCPFCDGDYFIVPDDPLEKPSMKLKKNIYCIVKINKKIPRSWELPKRTQTVSNTGCTNQWKLGYYGDVSIGVMVLKRVVLIGLCNRVCTVFNSSSGLIQSNLLIPQCWIPSMISLS